MTKFTDVLVHIDTLGLRSDAALIGLGAIGFCLSDPTVKPETIYNAISAESNDGRSCDLLSVDYWRNDPPYLDPFKRDMVILSDAVDQFIDFFHANAAGSLCVWLWRGSFEGMILTTVFEGLQQPLPWAYYSAEDARTFCAAAANYGDLNVATPYGATPEHQMERRVAAVRAAHLTLTRLSSRREAVA